MLGKVVDKSYWNASAVWNGKMLYLKAWLREAHLLSFCLSCFVCFPSNATQASVHGFSAWQKESQSPRMVWVARQLRDQPVLLLLPWAGMLSTRWARSGSVATARAALCHSPVPRASHTWEQMTWDLARVISLRPFCCQFCALRRQGDEEVFCIG